MRKREREERKKVEKEAGKDHKANLKAFQNG